MAKTLVFSFDGTGNEASDVREFTEDTSISNVLKMHILLGGGLKKDCAKTKTPAGDLQITHYYEGIGTRDRTGLIGKALMKARNCFNMAFAPEWGDVRRTLKSANEAFEKTYTPGDKIVIFGFSRGAAVARKFAAKILENSVDPGITVSFLGVFDTVAAMNGIHRKSEKIRAGVVFENGTLNENIERAVHAISLDENRTSFEPTLINKDAQNPNRILEVWFPGVHSDIGGGYWFDGLSDVAFAFMIAQCKATLRNDIAIIDGADISEVAEIFGAQQKQGVQDEMCADDIAIHPLANGRMHKHSGIMAISVRPRKIVVNVNDKASNDSPLVHESVKERFDTVPAYRPAALRGVEFTLWSANGRNRGVSGISGLRSEG